MRPKPKKILLLYTDKYYFVKQVYPFGLDLIAHHLRKYGYEVTIDHPFLPEPDLETNLNQIIAKTAPDFIGLGMRNLDTATSCEPFGNYEGQGYKTFFFLPDVKRVVDIVKVLLPKIPMVIGGGAFSISPEAILKTLGINYGIVGEGEEPLRQLLDAFPDDEIVSKIPGLAFRSGDDVIVNNRTPYTFEEDNDPIERETKFNYAYETGGMPVQVKRGCNRHCTYCVEPHLEGNKFVFKDLDAVIEELRFIASQHEGVRNIFFVDTEFNIPNLDYGSMLITKIIELELHDHFRFSSQFLPSPFHTDFAKLLKKAGFSIILTCDSFSDIVLEKNRSSYRAKESINTLELCEKFGLDCTVNLIFGLPGETYETIDQTIAIMMKYPPNAGRRYEYTFGGRIYQGTPLCRFIETRKSDLHVYGNRSEGFLEPYYYCAPENPLKLKKYVEQNFPFLYEYQNKDDSVSLQKLAVAYLADQALWSRAASKFLESDIDVCSASYDYLFRKLAESGEVKTARTISKKFMDAILQSGEVEKYSDQIPVIQYYMSILPSQD